MCLNNNNGDFAKKQLYFKQKNVINQEKCISKHQKNVI